MAADAVSMLLSALRIGGCFHALATPSCRLSHVQCYKSKEPRYEAMPPSPKARKTPDTLILVDCSGNLTSAQRFTTREHDIVSAARCSRHWIRSASFRTGVEEIVTLLANSKMRGQRVLQTTFEGQSD